MTPGSELLEALPVAVYTTDAQGRITFFNQAAADLWGHRPELGSDQWCGSWRLYWPDGRPLPHDQCPMALTLKEGRPARGIEAVAERPDGTRVHFLPYPTPLWDASGRLIGAINLLVDITERKRLERLKDEFLSTVSHELRTPLTSISGSLGLLIGGATGRLPEPAERLLAIAQSNSQRLVRLVNDILDIEKMESNRIIFNFKRVEARAVVQQAIEDNRGFADGYRVRIRLDPASVAGEVHADPDRLVQVMTNLLSNAIKFSPPDGEVVASVERRDDLIRISVRDHGPGIPLDFRPRMFEKFVQADATDARRKGGTGLGLSIVKQIVTRLGGAVDFEDAPGGGTVFHVDLDWREQVSERELDRDGQPGVARILLCADDPNRTITVREGLKQFGFATDLAHIRADAIARAAATPYGAIVVDLDLLEGEGVGLIRALRSQPQNRKTPIIGMTADARRDHDTLNNAEVDDWVEKPVDIERMAQVINRALIREPGRRPRILHVDNDLDVLEVVARALATTADVMSVASIEHARQALADHDFDLAVLDVGLGPVSGLDLLPDLRSRKGRAIPVIIFSDHGANLVNDPQVQASLGKSRAALDSLVSTVHDRLMPLGGRT